VEWHFGGWRAIRIARMFRPVEITHFPVRRHDIFPSFHNRRE
jgi:hypothetical protein